MSLFVCTISTIAFSLGFIDQFERSTILTVILQRKIQESHSRIGFIDERAWGQIWGERGAHWCERVTEESQVRTPHGKHVWGIEQGKNPTW